MTNPFKREVFHLIHCAALAGTIVLLISLSGGLGELNATTFETEEILSSWEEYGFLPAAFLYITRILTLLCLPMALFNFLGLVLFNAFPDQPKSKVTRIMIVYPIFKINSNLSSKSLFIQVYSGREHVTVPFVCFRVVTKGDFPQLVRSNILKNKNTCEENGLENFTFEVVTDQSISLVTSKRVRELVVPVDYSTKTGALYKSRALQYSLEKEVSYIVK
jgi:egghead protein (zeste-white 4 protein)